MFTWCVTTTSVPRSRQASSSLRAAAVCAGFVAVRAEEGVEGADLAHRPQREQRRGVARAAPLRAPHAPSPAPPRASAVRRCAGPAPGRWSSRLRCVRQSPRLNSGRVADAGRVGMAEEHDRAFAQRGPGRLVVARGDAGSQRQQRPARRAGGGEGWLWHEASCQSPASWAALQGSALSTAGAVWCVSVRAAAYRSGGRPSPEPTARTDHEPMPCLPLPSLGLCGAATLASAGPPHGGGRVCRPAGGPTPAGGYRPLLSGATQGPVYPGWRAGMATGARATGAAPGPMPGAPRSRCPTRWRPGGECSAGAAGHRASSSTRGAGHQLLVLLHPAGRLLSLCAGLQPGMDEGGAAGAGQHQGAAAAGTLIMRPRIRVRPGAGGRVPRRCRAARRAHRTQRDGAARRAEVAGAVPGRPGAASSRRRRRWRRPWRRPTSRRRPRPSSARPSALRSGRWWATAATAATAAMATMPTRRRPGAPAPGCCTAGQSAAAARRRPTPGCSSATTSPSRSACCCAATRCPASA